MLILGWIADDHNLTKLTPKTDTQVILIGLSGIEKEEEFGLIKD